MKTLNQFMFGLLFAAAMEHAAHGDDFTSTGSMTVSRYSHTASRLLDGRVLVAGGFDFDFIQLASAELYNPATGTWTNAGSLTSPLVGHTSTVLPNGKVLVAGGIWFSGGYGPLTTSRVQQYDPANGSWTYPGSLAQPRYGHTATLLPSGKVLAAGGTYLDSLTGNLILTNAELFSPATGTWSSTGGFGTKRTGHTATLLPNGKILAVGGQGTNNSILTSAELYDPATGKWTPTGSLGTAQSGHTATLLSNGKVLVVGSAAAELYDPASGTWSPTGNLGNTGAATLLPNGKVLVVGSATAELYDPATGTWSPTSNPGISGTATLMLNGKVLIAGGPTGSSGNAQLYESFLNPINSPFKLNDGSIKFSFNNPSGPSYRVLAATNVAAPLNTWSNLGYATEAPPGSGQFQFTDHQATNYPKRFYRVSSP
jgi:hypothetical protein